MSFANEAEFEKYIRALIKARVSATYRHIYALENKKAVDILICRDDPDEPALFFLEVKFHKQAHGRLGFGSASGGGFQPEIVARKPHYFEQNLRWVIGSEDDDGIIFVPSSEIRNFVSGGAVGPKFNNIQQRIFREAETLSEEEFVDQLLNWVLQ